MTSSSLEVYRVRMPPTCMTSLKASLPTAQEPKMPITGAVPQLLAPGIRTVPYQLGDSLLTVYPDPSILERYNIAAVENQNPRKSIPVTR
ncbi:hypothetical protein B9Z19DRAFT_1071129 [Tuber borchii]|uniref:Uncharacterized protein n=1 Tax=Tuber borchii TaxID=42251 RepID=A0A2T7A888_TUBBO|nr:hypothetical protein B9Z19DRAFT_1071129 [Tuber borchii]